MKVIALDDEPPALDVIESFCARIAAVELKGMFTKTGDAFDYLEKHPIDLILLDINMPSLSGIDFYKTIPQKVLVIFITSYSEHAVESYTVNAIDYLLKPFTFQRFEQAITRADQQLKLLQQQPAQSPATTEERHIILRLDYGLIKIQLDDVLFIEGSDNYVKIHLHQQKPVTIRTTMKALLDKLPDNEFIRVHRSYAVAIARIESVRKKVISIGGKEIPISGSYEESFNTIWPQ